MYCQFTKVDLIRTGTNLIFKSVLWKLIVGKKKDYLDSQFKTLYQNTENKERQLKKLQVLASKHISKEVKDTAKSIVYNLAGENAMSLSKEIVSRKISQINNL